MSNLANASLELLSSQVSASAAAIASDPMVAFSALQCGEEAVVISVSADTAESQRLATLGFVPGARVRMISCGQPCLAVVGRSRLSLRATDLDAVWVERRS